MQKPLLNIIYYITVFSFICGFLLTPSCKKDPPVYEITNLNNNTISIFGHAGMGLEFKYPIDTYESIEPVLRIGGDGSEMDLQMTSDSVLVLFHNTKLEEMTLCASGIVNDKTWPEIWGCHIASPYSYKIKLISFEALMDMLTESGKDIHNYTFTFDCKLYTNSNEKNGFLHQYANAVLKVMEKYNLYKNIFIESQDTVFLNILKLKKPDLKLFIYPKDFESGLQIAIKSDLYGITINNDDVTTEQIKRAHAAGKRITLWGLSKESDNVNAIGKSPDFVQTDKPIQLLKVFGKYKN